MKGSAAHTVHSVHQLRGYKGDSFYCWFDQTVCVVMRDVPPLYQNHHPRGAETHGSPWCASCSHQTWALWGKERREGGV